VSRALGASPVFQGGLKQPGKLQPPPGDGEETEATPQDPPGQAGKGASGRPGAALLSCGLVYSRDLDLKKPLYQRTAAYGHFGRDSFPWEVPKKLKY